MSDANEIDGGATTSAAQNSTRTPFARVRVRRGEFGGEIGAVDWAVDRDVAAVDDNAAFSIDELVVRDWGGGECWSSWGERDPSSRDGADRKETDAEAISDIPASMLLNRASSKFVSTCKVVSYEVQLEFTLQTWAPRERFRIRISAALERASLSTYG